MLEGFRALVRPLIALGSFLLLAVTGVMQITLPEPVVRIAEMAIGWYFMGRAADKAQKLLTDHVAKITIRPEPMPPLQLPPHE